MFGRMPVGGPKPAKSDGPPPPKGPPGLRIEHRVGIQAPAEVIWDVVRDLESWSAWNPLYPKASGEIRIGGKLNLTLAVPNQEARDIEVTVLDWVPNEQLHWRLVMLNGFIRTVRYIEIEQLAEASCIVSNGEYFGGLMGPSLGKRLGRDIHRGFREMGEALKAEAERRWLAQGAKAS